MSPPLYPDIRQRQLQPEIMNQPGLDEAAHRDALLGLNRVNTVCLTHQALWKPIWRLASRQPGVPLRVLDVACGGGDVAVRMAMLARRFRLPITFDGCDISPIAVSVASERARSVGVSCRFFQFDV